MNTKPTSQPDSEVVVITALCMQEHITDSPDSPFGQAMNKLRDSEGSYQYRQIIYSFALALETAFDTCAKDDYPYVNFAENLRDNAGDWDFGTVPLMCDLHANYVQPGDTSRLSEELLPSMLDTLTEFGKASS